MKQYPTDDYIWYEYASALGKLSLYKQANKAFDNAARYAHPKVYFMIWWDRGQMEERRGNYKAAEKWYLEALKVQPSEMFCIVTLGVLYFRWGKLEEAEETLRKVIENKGALVDEAYFNLGGVLVAQERYQEAIACYEKAIKIDPNYKLAKLRLKDMNQVLASKQNVDL